MCIYFPSNLRLKGNTWLNFCLLRTCSPLEPLFFFFWLKCSQLTNPSEGIDTTILSLLLRAAHVRDRIHFRFVEGAASIIPPLVATHLDFCLAFCIRGDILQCCIEHMRPSCMFLCSWTLDRMWDPFFPKITGRLFDWDTD